MDDVKKTDGYYQKLFDQLLIISEQCSQMDDFQENQNSQVYRTYSLDTKTGRMFYAWISDDRLLEVLRQSAVRLNHSPAQNEIFWVWRVYLKKRFHKWPHALKAAGLKKSAGKGAVSYSQAQKEKQEYQLLIKQVQQKAKEFGRIPHPQEIPELRTELNHYTNSWNEVVQDAKLDTDFFREKSVYKVEKLEDIYQKELLEIFNFAQTIGRAPLKSEIDDRMRKHLIQRCGSWRNVLYQIDLEPVMKKNPFSSTLLDTSGEIRKHKIRMQDCYYQVLKPDEQTKADLQQLLSWKQRHHRLPEKKDIPSEIRKRLQISCGSWANAVYQLEFQKKGCRK